MMFFDLIDYIPQNFCYFFFPNLYYEIYLKYLSLIQIFLILSDVFTSEKIDIAPHNYFSLLFGLQIVQGFPILSF